jgi:hypothetical protein
MIQAQDWLWGEHTNYYTTQPIRMLELGVVLFMELYIYSLLAIWDGKKWGSGLSWCL